MTSVLLDVMSVPRSSGPETDVSGLLCMESARGKKGFVLCLTARGKKNLLSQSRNVLLLRSTPEQEEGFYTASLSGNRGPLKVAYLHLNCRR